MLHIMTFDLDLYLQGHLALALKIACYVYNKILKFQFFANFSAFTIINIRGCVACNDLWPWPIFSRSFGLDLENRVRSVASTVLDGFFPYLVQMITSMRMCVPCDDLWPSPISSRSFDLVLTWDPTWLIGVGNHEAAGGILRTQAF